jgi:hypothetical protein
MEPCKQCGGKIRARNPQIHRLLCVPVENCTAAYRCYATASSRSTNYCEKEAGHDGSHKNGCVYW